MDKFELYKKLIELIDHNEIYKIISKRENQPCQYCSEEEMDDYLSDLIERNK